MGLFDEIAKNTKLGFKTGTTGFWDTSFIPCGVPPVDYILGGGVALGRILELFGNESSGKTLLEYLFLIQNTKRGGVSILQESEGAFNPDFYASLGGDPSTLLLKPAETVEDVFNDVVELAEQKLKGKISENVVVAWDSVAATATKHLVKEGMDKIDMSKAKMLSQGFQLITNSVKKAGIAMICINQTRQSIGTNDSATVTPGGKALPFFSSQRLELKYDGGSKTSLIRQIKDDKESPEIGRRVKCRVVKNKVAPAWKECVLPLYSYDGLDHPEFEEQFTKTGIDVEEALFDFYSEGQFFLPNRSRVVLSSGGWNSLDVSIDPEQTKWRKKEWTSLLEAKPELRTLVYSLLQPAAAQPEQLPPAPPISESEK